MKKLTRSAELSPTAPPPPLLTSDIHLALSIMRLSFPRLSPSFYLPSSQRIASPAQISSLINHANNSSACPAHGSSCSSCSTSPASSRASQLSLVSGLRKMSMGTGADDKEYAFEVSLRW